LDKYIKNNIYCLEHDLFTGHVIPEQKIENWKIWYIAFILMMNMQCKEYAIALDKTIFSKQNLYENVYHCVNSEEQASVAQQFYKAQLEIIAGCDLVTVNN
jgi:hypothetical protein